MLGKIAVAERDGQHEQNILHRYVLVADSSGAIRNFKRRGIIDPVLQSVEFLPLRVRQKDGKSIVFHVKRRLRLQFGYFIKKETTVLLQELISPYFCKQLVTIIIQLARTLLLTEVDEDTANESAGLLVASLTRKSTCPSIRFSEELISPYNIRMLLQRPGMFGTRQRVNLALQIPVP